MKQIPMISIINSQLTKMKPFSIGLFLAITSQGIAIQGASRDMGFTNISIQYITDTVKDKSSADSAWREVQAIGRNTVSDITLGKMTAEQIARREIKNRKYREAGLKFWQNYPNDIRRFEWLRNTLGTSAFPRYWKDITEGSKIQLSGSFQTIEIDREALSQWNKIYPSLRAEYLISPLLPEKDRIKFRFRELQDFLFTMTNPAYRNNQKLDMEKLKFLFFESAKDYYLITNTDKDHGAIPAMEMLFSKKTFFGLEYSDLLRFCETVEIEAPLKEIKNWAIAKKKYITLTSTPFQLKFKTIEGKNFNLEDLRGKVVLIDFWATWCAGCIAMMPRVKRYYNKFKSQGFEVVSVSIDSEDKMKEILKIEHTIGGSWPTLVIGGKNKADINNSLYKKIFDAYAFTSVPKMLLLNKEGYLVGESGTFISKNFEAYLSKLLAE